MKEINVLFLTSWYPNKLFPQNGNFIRRHAMAISKFCNVFVIHVISVENQKEPFVFEKTITNNITEIITYYKKTNVKIPVLSHFIKFFKMYDSFKKSYKLLKKEVKHIDITHVNVIYPAGIFARYLLKKYKIPFIITEHWTKFLSISKTKFSFSEHNIIKQVSKKASFICPVSYDLKNAMVKFGIKKKYCVIPNVVDTKTFYPEKNKIKSNRIRILHISHLENKHKNISGILNVIKRLSEERSDFMITISGNRNLDIHKEYARKINIPTEFISFEGSKTLPEVADSMRQHDLFLLFSHYENLPCVISEAHVSGIPVISSDVGGVKEMIDNDNGMLVDADNEKDLYENLIILFNKIKSYNSNLISEKAINRYSNNNVGNQYYNLYKTVLKLQ